MKNDFRPRLLVLEIASVNGPSTSQSTAGCMHPGSIPLFLPIFWYDARCSSVSRTPRMATSKWLYIRCLLRHPLFAGLWGSLVHPWAFGTLRLRFEFGQAHICTSTNSCERSQNNPSHSAFYRSMDRFQPICPVAPPYTISKDQ